MIGGRSLPAPAPLSFSRIQHQVATAQNGLLGLQCQLYGVDAPIFFQRAKTTPILGFASADGCFAHAARLLAQQTQRSIYLFDPMSVLAQMGSNVWPGALVVLGYFCQHRQGVSCLKQTVDSLSMTGHRFVAYLPHGSEQASDDLQLALRLALHGASPLPPVSTDQPELAPPACASCIPLTPAALYLVDPSLDLVMPL